MPRNVGWRVLGILALSVLLCGGGGCSAEAQSGAPQQQAGGQALPEGQAADLWRNLAELRAEVTQLRQEVTRLRAQVAQTGTGGAGTAGTARDASGTRTVGSPRAEVEQGTGGSGTAGTSGAAQGTGGAGTGGSGTAGTGARVPVVSDVPPAGSEVPAPQGTAVVNAVYTGVVRSVSERQVVIAMENGAPLMLGVDEGTRVLRDGRSIGAPQLKKGEQVRAVVDLVGQDKTLEIAVQPAATPEG